jgi:hypothetical protein
VISGQAFELFCGLGRTFVGLHRREHQIQGSSKNPDMSTGFSINPNGATRHASMQHGMPRHSTPRQSTAGGQTQLKKINKNWINTNRVAPHCRCRVIAQSAETRGSRNPISSQTMPCLRACGNHGLIWVDDLTIYVQDRASGDHDHK